MASHGFSSAFLARGPLCVTKRHEKMERCGTSALDTSRKLRATAEDEDSHAATVFAWTSLPFQTGIMGNLLRRLSTHAMFVG
jgi:hypothetical protein